MMAKKLEGKRVAMVVANGFEQSEMVEPRKALESEGAQVDLISLKKESVRAWNHTDWGASFDVDKHIAEADPDDYDAVVLPGGVMNPDYLRMDERAVNFVTTACEAGMPIAAICHGPWLLAEADVLHGRRVTSYPSLRTDLENADAEWVDEPVVVDGNFVTSRRPDDLPEFCQAVIESLSRPMGAHTGSELGRSTTRSMAEAHQGGDCIP